MCLAKKLPDNNKITVGYKILTKTNRGNYFTCCESSEAKRIRLYTDKFIDEPHPTEFIHYCFNYLKGFHVFYHLADAKAILRQYHNHRKGSVICKVVIKSLVAHGIVEWSCGANTPTVVAQSVKILSEVKA